MTKNAIAKRAEGGSVEAASEVNSHLDMILRAARDPTVDVAKMKELRAMYREEEAEMARRAFIVAKIKMRPRLPVVAKNGLIEIYAKEDKNKVRPIQSTPFARFEDIHEMCFPVLLKHGFDLDFRTGGEGDRIAISAVLSHKLGHREEMTLFGPAETSGSKNNLQGIGSTLSYLKRYTMCAILNIRTSDKGEFDDDGHAGGLVEQPAPLLLITSDQASTVRALLRETHATESTFLNHVGFDRIEDIPAASFEKTTALIKDTAARRRALEEKRR